MKRALVVSGGGAKGAFAVGAARILVEEADLKFDLFAGTSTGALFAPLAAAGLYRLAAELYTATSTASLLHQRPPQQLLATDSLFDSSPLREFLHSRVITAEVADRLLTGEHPLFLSAVSLQSKQLVFFTTMRPLPPFAGTFAAIGSRDELVDAALASGTEPFFMPPVTIRYSPQVDGKPARETFSDQFVDGGVRTIAPIEVALQSGADEVFVIMMSPATTRRSTTRATKLTDVLGTTISCFTSQNAHNDLVLAEAMVGVVAYANALRGSLMQEGLSQDRIDTIVGTGRPFPEVRAPRLVVIRPREPLPGDSLTNRVPDQAAMLLAGEAAARETLQAYLREPPAPAPVLVPVLA